MRGTDVVTDSSCLDRCIGEFQDRIKSALATTSEGWKVGVVVVNMWWSVIILTDCYAEVTLADM
jgi:hypothetical protein